MLITRPVASIASIMLGLSAALFISMPQKASAQVIYACENPATGLLYVVAANGTCPKGWTLLNWPSTPAASSPPLFQGIMVDAKGMTVGRLIFNFDSPFQYVVRQINGIWVIIPVTETGFQGGGFQYFYQSTDCTGQAYLQVNQNYFPPNPGPSTPASGYLATLPPANIPSIYFAGTPASILTMHSANQGGVCCNRADTGCVATTYFGLPQSVPVSSLGLTLPFSIQ